MATIPRADGAWNLGARFGISDSDAQILYFAASVALTIVLVILTIYYTWQNRRMAEAMHRQNELSTRPVIVASIAEVPSETSLVWPGGRLTIRTIGMGPALFIRLNSVVVQKKEVPEEELIARFLPVVDILAAGETATLTCHLEAHGNATLTDLGDMFWFYVFKIQQEYDVAIRYDDVGGQRYLTPMRFGKDGARLVSPPVKERLVS